MRLASYKRAGEWVAAVIGADGRIVDAAAAAGEAGLDGGGSWGTVRGILGQPSDELGALGDAAEALASAGEPEAVLDAASVTLGPPVPDPQKILCVGLNYRAHAAEGSFEAPEVPLVFAKFPNVLIGSGAPIELPAGNGEHVDYEGEIAVVIGRATYRVSEDEGLDAVAGWMPFNDVSARDLQTQTSQWTVGKSPDTFGPCGPSLVLDNPWRDGGLVIETRINGEQVQHAHTDQMIFSTARLISYLSATMTLVAGDIIVTGTPEGVGAFRDPPRFLRDGDVVEVQVGDELLTNPVRRR